MRPVANPPNPWAAHTVEWIDAPPAELEVYEEHARTIVTENDSPDVGFRFSVNPYRGCFHACAYCVGADTPILMANGTTKPIRDLAIGDVVYGTKKVGGGRELVGTCVLNHWKTSKLGHRVRLRDGTELIASGDHRFLTRAGWKYVAKSDGSARRTCLTPNDHVVGVARDLRVAGVDALGLEMEMFDITTGTGDFIADGVVSHNCYARPSHQYWDFGAGTDFERKIIAKVNAPEKLRETFLKKSWKGDLIAFSGNTDCYQPLEASYQLTRRCLEICAEFRNPVSLITKGVLIRRDIDVLARLAREARVHVNISVAFADDEMARKIEPSAPLPSKRFEALRALADAGIPVGIGLAPIIPGLNDGQIAEVLERGREAGATSAFRVMLRLAAEVKPVFLGRLEEAYPDRLKKVISAVRDVRGGALYRNGFGERMNGSGPRWDAVDALFSLTCRRLGLNAHDENEEVAVRGAEEATTFRRPEGAGGAPETKQLSLFGGTK